MGNSFAKMCNCSSCGQEENSKDNEEIQSKDPSTKIETCKAISKPIIDDNIPPSDLTSIIILILIIFNSKKPIKS